MMDWGGVLVGEHNELSEGAKAAIVESITREHADEEKSAADLMGTIESGVEFAHRNGPKIKSLFDLFRGKPPTKEPGT